MMPEESNRDPRPINETEGEDGKIRERVKMRKCKLSETQEEETRTRNLVKKGKRRGSELGEDSKICTQVKKGKGKSSEKHRKKRYLETETEKIDPQPEKKDEESSRKFKKKYCDMTKDEVVNLCFILDRPRARLVVDNLRKYLIQVSESEGFDCDIFPGHFSGVTSVFPGRYCPVNPLLKSNVEMLANEGIAEYNLANKETKYKVVDVETVNVYVDAQCTYYVTFNARDEAKDGALKTFQAIVVADWRPPIENYISHVLLCRAKLS